MFDSTRRPTHRRPTALERAAVVLVATALTWATGRQTVRAADDTTAPGRTSEEIRRNWGTETAKDG
ncbi:MAG: hypothetical protein ABEL76_11380, partial [Bradymonadaceae bacterium]